MTRGTNPADRVRAPAPAEWARRGLALAAVIGLHVLIGVFIVGSPDLPDRRSSTPLTLILLDLPAEPHGDARAGEAPDAPTAARPTARVAPLVRVAGKGPAAPVGVLPEATALDVAQIERICGTARWQRSHSGWNSHELIFLVRVEQDGHVSDSKIEAGSGMTPMDEAAEHCLRARVVLTPNRVEGQPVVAWQRIRLPAVEGR